MTLLRRLLLVVAVFCVCSCDRNRTPTWEKADSPAVESQVTIEEATSPIAQASSAAEPKTNPGTSSEFRFIAYNVRNWLVMDRPANGQGTVRKAKPDDEKAAVISILSKHHPDVIGLCEIGTAEDLAEIQQRLKDAGVELPHSHYTGGSDPVRHLGLLSKFPIVHTERPKEVDYKLHGKSFSLNRGILDATVEARGRKYRFLGAHLKSKREIEDADQEEMRQAEARLLRQHVDTILALDPQERLVVYGDFNDTRASPSVKIITGNYGQADYLTPLPAEDRSGTSWTHFWNLHDVYARIDFITVSKALKPEVDFKAARVLDDKEWEKASDHRPLMGVFRTKDPSR